MASPEHEFVSATFLAVAEELAHSEIFTFAEADRGRFDFACLLTQHKHRAVVGQTLQHAAGIEKDLNWLLLDSADSVPVYLYSHTARHVGRIAEVVGNARDRLPDRTSLLRLYPYPTFDADDERQRSAVENEIRRQVADDLLLNVVFGRLAGSDIQLFLLGVGIRGLQIAILETIALDGFLNFPALAQPLKMKPTTLRSRVANLVAAGMLRTPIDASLYAVTQRGRVFLRICALLRGSDVGPELTFILDRLGLLVDGRGPDAWRPRDAPFLGFRSPPTGHQHLQLLIDEIDASQDAFGIEISGGPYEDDPAGRFAAPTDLTWVER
jgi:hypothetical protein